MKKTPLTTEQKKFLRDLVKVRFGKNGRYFFHNLILVASNFQDALQMIENAAAKKNRH